MTTPQQSSPPAPQAVKEWTWFCEPVICSQGGIPYNKVHIEYWKARAEQAERERDELIKMHDAARGNADTNYTRLQQAERDLAAAIAALVEIADAGADRAHDIALAALSRPASTEPSLGESAGNDEQIGRSK